MPWWRSNGDGTGRNIEDPDPYTLRMPCGDEVESDTMSALQGLRNTHVASCDDYRCKAARR